ncbi:MAG: ferredoxin reductase family protein [Promicromonosporaceae bacterium]|nr:ferredoxin reductase family protein [Promicromonosporaceae bacterium]
MSRHAESQASAAVIVPVPRPRRSTKSPALWQAAALSVVVASTVSVIVLWLRGYTLDHTGPGAVFTMIGGATGLIGAHLLLWQIITLARIPLFERGIGRDVVVRWHRWLGFAAFGFIGVHVLFVVEGARRALGRPAEGIGDTSLVEPGVAIAFVGTALMGLFVVALSFRFIRRRLRYELWHLAHLVAYVAAALSVPHQLWVGRTFMNSTAASVYWWTLWGAAFAATGYWRVLLPLWRTRRYDVRVADVEPHGTRGILLTMRGRDLGPLRARGGQFFTWRFGGSPGWTRGHPISLAYRPIASRPGGPIDTWQIAVRVVGDGTRRMSGLTPGTRVGFEGPYGRVTGDLRHGNRLLMFGAGAGVGPMMAILAEQEWAPGQAVLVTRDRVAADQMMRPEIEALVERRGLTWHAIYGEPNLSGTGPTWMSADDVADGAQVIRDWAADLADTDVFLCGPPVWMRSIGRDLRAAGVPRRHIHTESFDL